MQSEPLGVWRVVWSFVVNRCLFFLLKKIPKQTLGVKGLGTSHNNDFFQWQAFLKKRTAPRILDAANNRVRIL